MKRRSVPPPAQMDLFGSVPSPAPPPAASPPLTSSRPVSARERTTSQDVIPMGPTPEQREIAAALPPNIMLGTSSWSFPGWRGIVYASEHAEGTLSRHGLKAYAAHPLLRTVGLDRSYYGPVPEQDLAAYATQLPSGFRFVVKTWEEITLPVFPRHRRYGPRAGQRSEHFLNADVMKDLFLRPFEEACPSHCGPFVLEFSPMPTGAYGSPTHFYARLDAFLSQLPTHFEYAVELRNAELMTPDYAAVLKQHRVGHVYNRWTRTPPISRQRELLGDPWGPTTVARIMLPEGATYESRMDECFPFDRIINPDEQMRVDVVELARDAIRRRTRLMVIVNNKAEGSAPLTCFALAERIVTALGLSAG
ncbi:MAG: DUF72 domain-containing protein [Myxococcota bacterium]